MFDTTLDTGTYKLQVKTLLLDVTAKSDQDPDLEPDHNEVKSWIRICIKANANPQHWF
jgi:hypothetical protein